LESLSIPFKSLNSFKSFAAKYIVLPVGLNATAGAFAGVLLGGPALITTTSGAISGALQSIATKPRNWVLEKLDSKLEGTAKAIAIGTTMFAVYAIHIPVLLLTSQVLFLQSMALGSAVKLTALGGGIGMLEYLAAQQMVDDAKKGEDVALF
jgi:hypothetical protein